MQIISEEETTVFLLFEALCLFYVLSLGLCVPHEEFVKFFQEFNFRNIVVFFVLIIAGCEEKDPEKHLVCLKESRNLKKEIKICQKEVKSAKKALSKLKKKKEDMKWEMRAEEEVDEVKKQRLINAKRMSEEQIKIIKVGIIAINSDMRCQKSKSKENIDEKKILKRKLSVEGKSLKKICFKLEKEYMDSFELL